MKFLRINSLLFVLFFTSCSLVTTKDLVKNNNTISWIENNYFANPQKDYIYKTSINVYGHYFGGIMIFKKLANNHHRIVFTTEFGNKLFDFEANNGVFKKNFIIESLNKKLIVNTLQKDFEILLQEKNKVLQLYENSKFNIYQVAQDKRYNFYFINKKNNELRKITHTTKHKEKVDFLFTEIENLIAKKITITHKNIKLSINLSYIN